MKCVFATPCSQLYELRASEDIQLLLPQCVQEIKDQLEIKPTIFVWGAERHQARDVGFFSNESNGYFYSNKLMKSKPLTPSLEMLLQKTNDIFKSTFNGILVNYYENGNNYISAHSDDEWDLDPIGVVAIAIGAERMFRIRYKHNKQKAIDYVMKQGYYVHMAGDFQQDCTHEIPKQTKIVLPRYSFTFRRHKT